MASYYDEVLAFVDVLDAGGHTRSAQAVEAAVRGGATSGEILTHLALALSRFLADVPDAQVATRAEAARLLDTAERALRSVGQYPR